MRKSLKLLHTLGLLLILSCSGYTQTITLYLTTGGGFADGELWCSITTGPNGTGTTVWAQGGGPIGTSSGALTDEPITVNCGATLYLNAYDEWDDSWNGSATYELRDATGGGGNLIINNGGVSPDDGTDSDPSNSWDGTSSEIETSEMFDCPCKPDIGTASVDASNCSVNATFDVQMTVNSAGPAGGSVVVSDGGINPNQTVSSFPTTVTFTGYSSGTNVTLTATASGCSETSNTVTHTCPCDPDIGMASVVTTNCSVDGTFGVQLTVNSPTVGSSVTISDGGTNPNQTVTSFPSTVTFTGYTSATSVTLNVDNGFCDVDANTVSHTCPCDPDIGTASTITTNCNVDGTFDVQLAINSATIGSTITVSDGGTNPNQTINSFPSTVTFTGYASGTSVTLNADNGFCDIDANTVSHTCTCTQPTIGTATTDGTNCVALGTFDVSLTITAPGMGTSVTVSDGGTNPNQTVTSFPTTVTFTGYASGTNVTLNAANFFCNVNSNTVTESCIPGTSCATAIAITDGYTASGVTTPGTNGPENWVTSADVSCGSGAASGFEDSDIIIYEYTTGATGGESFYFTIDHNNTVDGDHQTAVWTGCAAGVLTGCVESEHNSLDDITGVCAQSLSANTTYYIGVSKRYPSLDGEDLDYDVIDFTVEASLAIPDDECASAPFLSSLVDYDGSTRCNYTPSTGSPSGCGSMQNDSWVSFVASDPTVSINYSVTDCSNNDGIQLVVFSGSCGSLSEVAGSCINPTGNNVTGNWSFSGLTPGNTYYIRADGYAGDLCNYNYDPLVGVLPVELISFHGKSITSGYNRIEWVTASEINNAYFIIEYSYDGVNFEEVTTVEGQGNSVGQNEYFTYHQPNRKKTFYRMHQIDFDGQRETSKVIVIENDEVASPQFQLFPNPTENGLASIQIENIEEIIAIEIFNSLGQIVFQLEETELTDNEIRFDLSPFGKGIYYITINGKHERLTEKLIYNKR